MSLLGRDESSGVAMRYFNASIGRGENIDMLIYVASISERVRVSGPIRAMARRRSCVRVKTAVSWHGPKRRRPLRAHLALAEGEEIKPSNGGARVAASSVAACPGNGVVKGVKPAEVRWREMGAGKIAARRLVGTRVGRRRHAVRREGMRASRLGCRRMSKRAGAG